jgi:hypothetical protein
VLEIRAYNLHPGMEEPFQTLFETEALPMLRRWQVDVVAYGQSLHDRSSFYLMRAYDDLAQREHSQDAFYGSDEWRQGPRAGLLACIENYTSTVLEVDDVIVAGLRKSNGQS